MLDTMEGIDAEILNEAIRYGLEFIEEAERRQRQVQAQNPQHIQPQRSPINPPQHPGKKRRSKHRKGTR